MSRPLTDEEILMEKEGHGRFNLRRSAQLYPIPAAKRTRSGPRAVIKNKALAPNGSIGFDRTKYRPKLVKDAMGNDVRVMVKIR